MDYGAAPLPLVIHLEQFDKAIADNTPEPELNQLAKLLQEKQITNAVHADTPIALGKSAAWFSRLTERDSNWFTKPESLSKAEDWDQPLTDGDVLQKREALATRRSNITAFVKRGLALGETVESLAAHAESHDAETARLIREVGKEVTQ